MALRHLVYRCPYCGHDPVVGAGVRARCPGCARTFEPGSGGTRILVTGAEPGGEQVEAHRLLTALAFEESGAGAGSGEPSVWSAPAAAAEGEPWLEADAVMRAQVGEAPIRVRNALLGFAERLGPKRKGVLRLDRRALRFLERRGRVHVWSLLDVRAVQGTSSAFQISPKEGGVVAFRLAADSPRRWEEALKSNLRAAWREADLGEIVEFQPRIRSS